MQKFPDITHFHIDNCTTHKCTNLYVVLSKGWLLNETRTSETAGNTAYSSGRALQRTFVKFTLKSRK